MTRQETFPDVIDFSLLTTGRLDPKIWVVAFFLGVALIGAAGLLLRFGGKASAVETTVSLEGSGSLDSHQIVDLVRATILQRSGDEGLAKQIADTLAQEDRLGDFQKVQTPAELASVLTKRIREVCHDSRYQVSYADTPPDIAEAHGRSIYRITKHLSVALPSV
jgi:hypothetical protein